MSSYFNIPSGQKKRKRSEIIEPVKKRSHNKTTARDSKHILKKPIRDESISGSEDESDNYTSRKDAPSDNESVSDYSSEAEDETAAERRLKLAQRYLENIRTEVDEIGFDAEKIDRDLIAERLVEDSAESKGLLYRRIATDLDFGSASNSWARWNSDTVTSVATCAPWLYTVTHDIGLAKWKIQELPENQWVSKRKGYKKRSPKPPPKRKPEQVVFVKGDKRKAKDKSYQGHFDKILTVAASEDGKYVVTGGEDRRIVVWDAETLKCLQVFTQHRDAVTSVVFRRGTNQLYSSSKDRTVKIWSLDELAYVETLFGHQDEVMDISALAQERCVSVGARDRTARLWKVVEETQLVFRGGGGGGSESKQKVKKSRAYEGSMDRVAMIDEEMFVTGSDNGSISLWATHKKKPIFTMPLCHGIEPPLLPGEVSADMNPETKTIPIPQPRWITALATIPYSDVVLSGSWDGFLRAWKVSEDKKRLEAVGVVGSQHPDSTVEVNSLDNKDQSGIHAEEKSVEGVRGIINDISIFERGDRGKDGVCIIAAVGKENRMGRWQKLKAKNGAVVFEVPYIKSRATM